MPPIQAPEGQHIIGLERNSGGFCPPLFAQGTDYATIQAKGGRSSESGADLTELHADLFPDGVPGSEDLFYVFVVKAMLGHAIHTLDGLHDWKSGADVFVSKEQRELVMCPDLPQAPGSGRVTASAVRYHSLVAELGKKIIRFREFLVYNSSQVVEGYLMVYTRDGDEAT